MKPVRGVIFDLFHTLTEPESVGSELLPGIAEALGIDRRAWDSVLLESSRWRLVGEVRDPHEIVRRLARHIDPHMPDATIRHALEVRTRRFADILRRIPAYNVAAIRALRDAGCKVALLSNADAIETASYGGCPLSGLFDVEMFSCDAGCAKPEPEIFHACLDALGLAAAECVFVGDGGSSELEGAKAVGMRTVFVSGAIEAHWPERIAPRAAVADHHVRWVPELLPWLGISGTSQVA
jgi:putative hydrolase of the HAD superfamily